MSSIVFEKGIVAYTCLVIPEEVDRNTLQIPPVSDEEKANFFRDMEAKPAVFSEFVVRDFFRVILQRVRPQGVVADCYVDKKPVEPAHVALLREQIERQERSGHILTLCIEFTRAEPLPFPGMFWLTGQVQEVAAKGVYLLSMQASQVPVHKVSAATGSD